MTEIHDALKQVESANTTTIENGSVSTSASDLTVAPGGAGAKVVLTTNSKDIEIYDGDISSATGALSLTPQSGVLSIVGATQTITVTGSAIASSVGVIDIVGATETLSFDNSDISNSAGPITITPFDGTAAVVGATDTINFTSGSIETGSGDLDFVSPGDIVSTANFGDIVLSTSTRETTFSGRDITYDAGVGVGDYHVYTVGHLSARYDSSATVTMTTNYSTFTNDTIYFQLCVPANCTLKTVKIGWNPQGTYTIATLRKAEWNASTAASAGSMNNSGSSLVESSMALTEVVSSNSDTYYYLEVQSVGSPLIYGIEVSVDPAGPNFSDSRS